VIEPQSLSSQPVALYFISDILFVGGWSAAAQPSWAGEVDKVLFS